MDHLEEKISRDNARDNVRILLKKQLGFLRGRRVLGKTESPVFPDLSMFFSIAYQEKP